MTTNNEPLNTNIPAHVAGVAINATTSYAETLAEAALYTQAPWLKLPVVNTIFKLIFDKIVSEISKALQTGATFKIIDTQISGEQTAISKALIALIAAQKSGDKNAIQKAIQDYSKAQSALVTSDGSAPTV